MNEQRRRAVTSQVFVQAMGLDPASNVLPLAKWTDPEVELERQVLLDVDRQRAMSMLFAQDNVLLEANTFANSIADMFKERNTNAFQLKENMTPEEEAEYRRSLSPVPMDATVIAGWRDRFMKLDIEMKKIDPNVSVFTHPSTSRLARFIAAESGPTTPGYFQSQDPELGEGAESGQKTVAIGEALFDPLLKLGYGVYDMAGRYVEGVSGGVMGWARPQSYIEGADGKLYMNVGRIPGVMDLITGVGAAILGENIERKMGRVNRLRELELMQASGFDKLARGALGVATIFWSYGPMAGKAMGYGASATLGARNLIIKGLERVGAGGTFVGAVSPRVIKITELASKWVGSAVGLGAMEMGMEGDPEKYGEAFESGAKFAPFLLFFGAIGRASEKSMLMRKVKGPDGKVSWVRRKHMPERVAAVLSAEIEAAGFATLEVYQQEALWGLLQDPSETTWQTYIKNMVGFGIGKGIKGGGLTDPAGESAMRQFVRTEARGALGEEVFREAGREKSPEAYEREFYEKEKVVAEERRQASEGEQIEGKEPVTREGEIEDPARAEAREKAQGRDPLEDPTFKDRPPEEQQRIMKRRSAIERRRESEEIDVERRSGEERREGERREEPQLPPEASQLSPELEARIKESGHPKELLAELGRARQERREATTVEAAEEAYRKMLQIEQHLDALEARQDPLVRAQVRELEAKEILEPQDPQAPGVGRGHPGPSAGKALGGSMGPAAAPHRQVEAVPGTKPITYPDLRATMEGRQAIKGIQIPGFAKRVGGRPGTAVQLGMKSGRLVQRKGLGVFKMYENITRTKGGYDMVVDVHEFGHAVQDQVLLGPGRSFTKGVREWYESMSPEVKADIYKILEFYPGREKLQPWELGSESWAEWMARNTLMDETLRPEVPHLSRWMDQWIGAKEQAHFREQYDVLQRQAERYIMQGGAKRSEMERAESVEPQGDWYDRLSAGLKKRVDAFAKTFFDDMINLRRSEAKALEISKMDPRDFGILETPSRFLDAIRNTAGKQSENWMIHFTHNLKMERTGPPLQELMRSEGMKGHQKDWWNYVYAVRSAEQIRKGKGQQSHLSDHVQAIKEIGARNPVFESVIPKFKIFTDSALDILVEANAISEKDAQLMKDYNSVWVPFTRVMDSPTRRGGGRGGAKSLKATTGGTQQMMEAVTAMRQSIENIFTMAHSYMAKEALYMMALKGQAGGLATIVPKDRVPKTYRIDEVVAELKSGMKKATGPEADAIREQFGVIGDLIGEAGLSDAAISLWGQRALPRNDKDSLMAFTPRLTEAKIESIPMDRRAEAIKLNNEMQWLEVDIPTYEVFMGLDAPVSPWFLTTPIIKQIVKYPYTWSKFILTDANPAFAAVNLLRDGMSTPVFDRHGKFQPLGGFRKIVAGFTELVTKGKYAEMYQASGTRIGSVMSESTVREMRGEATTLAGQAWEGVRTLVDGWTTFLSKGEAFIRIAEYKEEHQLAKSEGKSDLEAALRGSEAGREITINFSRGGTFALWYNQMVPYFNAGLQGQRKLFRALAGLDAKNDVERARMQRAVLANGIANITAPAVAIWMMSKDEDWYKDLPEWRKIFYFNTKIGDQIITVPVPYEMGVLFASIPIAILDWAYGSNPASTKELIKGLLIPHMRGLGNALPPAMQGILETETGQGFFTQRELVPEWIRRSRPPEEQVVPSTSVTAQSLFKIIQPIMEGLGIDNPVELENLLGNFTGGGAQTGFKMIDEVFALKDHPGIAPGILTPLSSFYHRFGRQEEHGSSRTVDELYNRERVLSQKGDQASSAEIRELNDIKSAQDEISELRRQRDAGEITPEQANKQSFQIANQILQSVR